MSLTRSTSVLDYISRGRDGVKFAQPDMEPGTDVEHIMPLEKWEWMGKPEHITVTVQPGDLLNGPGEVTGVDVPDGQQMIPLAELLRPVLLHHHPVQDTREGPLKGCYCGAVRLGEDVIEHVADEVARVLTDPEPMREGDVIDGTEPDDHEDPPGQGPLNDSAGPYHLRLDELHPETYTHP